MFEPLTLTLAEIAARWNLTPRQLLQHAQQSGMPPLYFDYEGLVFKRSDSWHRHGGDYREIERRDVLEEMIRKGEAQLQRRARGTLTEWEQLSAEEAVELRKSIEGYKVEVDEIKDKLETRRIERNQRVFRGYVRALNGTLWEIETKGSAPSPTWALLAGEMVVLEPLPGHVHDPNTRLTSDSLVAMMPEVKAIEAYMKAKDSAAASSAGAIAMENAAISSPPAPAANLNPVKESASAPRKEAILVWLRNAGYDPLQLPKFRFNAPGAKAAVKQAMLETKGLGFTDSTFEKAWEEMRSEGTLQDREE